MKNHLKENWKYYISPTLLACLLLAGLWYWRGVGFAHIAPDIVPETVSVNVMTLSDDGKELLSAQPRPQAVLRCLGRNGSARGHQQDSRFPVHILIFPSVLMQMH